ncbi:MAG TPA: histidine kinase [Thermoanaerobaculia bacterium]
MIRALLRASTARAPQDIFRMDASTSIRRDMSDVAFLTLAISVLWLLLHAANIADHLFGLYVHGKNLEVPARALVRLVVTTVLSGVMTPLLIYLLRRIPRGERLNAAAWMHFIGVVLAFAVLRTVVGAISFAALWDYALTWHGLKRAMIVQTHTHAVHVAIAGAIILLYDNAQSGLERERLRAALTVSRMQQLRAQFRPHFLLNTLNTIATLVHRDPKTADDLITSLAALLRWTVDLDDVAEIPLEDELEFVQDYLTIQQVRFGARLQASIDAADDVLQCSVIPQVLQPLVENAIIHGIPHAYPTGRVRITARIDRDTLVLQVRDSGSADPAAISRGIGLKNLEERLTTMYGGRGTLSFCNEADELVAEVRIPARAEAR